MCLCLCLCLCVCTNIKQNSPTAHRINGPTPHFGSTESSTLANRCVHKYGEYFTYPLQHLKELKRQKKGEFSRNHSRLQGIWIQGVGCWDPMELKRKIRIASHQFDRF